MSSYASPVSVEKSVNVFPLKSPVAAVAYPVRLEQASISPQPDCIGVHTEEASYLGDS